MINVVPQSSQPPVSKAQTGINVNVTADAIIFIAFLLWVVWKRAIKPSFAEQLGSFFIPVDEERKLDTILAQIGVITGASRVILAAFHNGALDSDGYHLQRVSAINTYIREGERPMVKPVKNLPIDKIAYELDQMLKLGDWHEIKCTDDLPSDCQAHMKNNRMACMHNRIIKVGNLPIGILSLQYSQDYGAKRKSDVINKQSYEGLLEDLYGQIVGILRQRVVNPGPIRKVAGQVFGLIKL